MGEPLPGPRGDEVDAPGAHGRELRRRVGIVYTSTPSR